MNIAPSLRGKALASTLSVLALMALALVVLLSRSADAPAREVQFNNLDCRGHIEKAPPSADDGGDTPVKYVFACNGPITGYQIQPNLEVLSMETETFGADKTGAPYANDAFSCSGNLPGFAINCVGFAGFLDNAKRTYDTDEKSYSTIVGTFTIDGDICAEPRVDPLLSVVTSGIDAKGQPTTAISGPFDLGRPVRSGCKYTKNAVKRRIPRDGKDTDASDTDIG